MGKIRVKTVGDESKEKEQKKDAKKRQEAKKAVKVEGNPEEKIATQQQEQKPADTAKQATKKKEKSKNAAFKVRSRKYQVVAKLVDRNKTYTLKEALTLLPQLKISKFDETVELHINTTETGISGTLTLPHGTGKQTRVVIADETLIAQIEKGKIDFDVLIATPQMMPKLAKVAKILGPKGLMPNPKNNTISNKPEEAIKKFEAGQMRFKTESKSPVMHISVGKLSFGDKKLTENIQTVITAVQAGKIKNATLKSTMSPGIKVQLAA